MIETLILRIGQSKTGTSALQTALSGDGHTLLPAKKWTVNYIFIARKEAQTA